MILNGEWGFLKVNILYTWSILRASEFPIPNHCEKYQLQNFPKFTRSKFWVRVPVKDVLLHCYIKFGKNKDSFERLATWQNFNNLPNRRDKIQVTSEGFTISADFWHWWMEAWNRGFQWFELCAPWYKNKLFQNQIKSNLNMGDLVHNWRAFVRCCVTSIS